MLDAQKLTDHLVAKFGLAPGSFDPATPLFSSSLLDSFSMVDLIMFIEKSAGIRLNPADVTLDHLDSIERILSFVNEQRAA